MMFYVMSSHVGTTFKRCFILDSRLFLGLVKMRHKLSAWRNGKWGRQWNHTRVLRVTANFAVGRREAGLYMRLNQLILHAQQCCLCQTSHQSHVLFSTEHLSHFLSLTIALTEFQNKRIDVKQTERRFGNALRLSGFLTLMLQEVSGGELSHGALGPLVPPFPELNSLPGAPGCRRPRSVPCCYVSTPLISRNLWETG